MRILSLTPNLTVQTLAIEKSRPCGMARFSIHDRCLMRLLLDECLPVELAVHLPGHEAKTARQMGWLGIKNGRLPTRWLILDCSASPPTASNWLPITTGQSTLIVCGVDGAEGQALVEGYELPGG